MKKWLYAFLLLLLAGPALAQIGSPGISNPPATVSVGLPPALAAGATISGTAETILFKLDGNTASTEAFLRFTNVADSTKVVTFATRSSGSPTFSVSAANSTSTNAYFLTPTQFNITVAGADNGTPLFDLQDLASNTFLSFTNIATPTNVISMAQDSSVPSLTTTVTDGVDTGEFRIVAKGVKASALAVSSSQEWASLIQGGFTLDGTTTASPASTVTVTVVDTTPTIVDGDVQVCGYEDTTNQTNQLKTCETIDFSGGAAALATTAAFIEVTNIKASSFSVLGGGGDETIAAEFTTGAVSILAAVNLTNSTKSVFTASLSGDSWNYQAVTCLDLQGCDLTLGESIAPVEGHELLLALQAATTAIVFVDVDAQMEMAGDANDTLNALDVIKFIYSGGAWLQVSLSEN